MCVGIQLEIRSVLCVMLTQDQVVFLNRIFIKTTVENRESGLFAASERLGDDAVAKLPVVALAADGVDFLDEKLWAVLVKPCVIAECAGRLVIVHDLDDVIQIFNARLLNDGFALTKDRHAIGELILLCFLPSLRFPCRVPTECLLKGAAVDLFTENLLRASGIQAVEQLDDAQQFTLVSKISEENLFYLMRRGINEEKAKELIIMGFLDKFK